MVDNKIDQLYEHYNKLVGANPDQIKEFEGSYLAILNAVKGSSQEKQLCSQFISKFFVHFPDHYEVAIDTLLDLCEDDDPNIRRRAIKELPNICKECKQFASKIGDVLFQLLLSDDQIELNIVNQALITLANFDIKSFIHALFGQILEGEEESRERLFKFLKSKFSFINNELLTKEIEELFLNESKKVLIDVTKDEFIILMDLLSSLKISKTVAGHNILLSMIKDQAELNNDFEPSDIVSIDKFLMCVRRGIPYFSQFSPSLDFVRYICFKILPNLNLLKNGLELEVLQVLCEIISFTSPTTAEQANIDLIEQCQDHVFNCLLDYIPKPPEDLSTSSETSTDELPSTQFSHVECLLYCLHQLCKMNPKYFTERKLNEFKDFKTRLQYLALGVQSYVNKLKKAISLLKPEELKKQENKIKEIALMATTNINTLTKDFFKNPPLFKTVIQLSFKSSKAPMKEIGGNTTVITSTTGTSSTAAGDNLNQSITRKRQPITAPEGSTNVKRERKFPKNRFNKSPYHFYKPRHENFYMNRFKKRA